MCRFVYYQGALITVGSLVTEPRNSLIHQSFDNEERVEPLNGDGFGIAWYAPRFGPEPAQFRSISPAWNNQNLRHLARVTESHTILSHIRAASPGLPVTQLNCHPFVWQNLAFMHNGFIAGFQKTRRAMLEGLSDPAYHAVLGSTDSEAIFGVAIQHYLEIQDQEIEDPTPMERLATALRRAVEHTEALRRDAGIDEPSFLNLVLSDGQRAAITRYVSADPEQATDPERANSLYVHSGRRYICLDGICEMVDPAHYQEAVIVSSERLSDDEGWRRVEPNTMLTVNSDLTVESVPLEV